MEQYASAATTLPNLNPRARSAVRKATARAEPKWDGPDVALSALAAQNLSNGKPLPDGIGIPEAQTYSVRSKDFRYIICPDGSEELYDHRKDPHEWVNLANRPECAAIQKELRAKAEQMVGKKLGEFYQTNSYNLRVPKK